MATGGGYPWPGRGRAVSGVTYKKRFNSKSAVWYIIPIIQLSQVTRRRLDPEICQLLEGAYQQRRKEVSFTDKDTGSRFTAFLDSKRLYMHGMNILHAHLERVCEEREEDRQRNTAVGRGISLQTSNENRKPIDTKQRQMMVEQYKDKASKLVAWLKDVINGIMQKEIPANLNYMKLELAEIGRIKTEDISKWLGMRKEILRIYEDLQSDGAKPAIEEESLGPGSIEQLCSRFDTEMKNREVRLTEEIARLESLESHLKKLHEGTKHLNGKLDDIEHRIRNVKKHQDTAYSLQALNMELQDIDDGVKSLMRDAETLQKGGHSNTDQLPRVLELQSKVAKIRNMLFCGTTLKPFQVSENVMLTVQHQKASNGAQVVETNRIFQRVQECLQWIDTKQAALKGESYGNTINLIKQELDQHGQEHQSIQDYRKEVDHCIKERDHTRRMKSWADLDSFQLHDLGPKLQGEKLDKEEQERFDELHSKVQSAYGKLLDTSSQRLEWLQSLLDFVQKAVQVLDWLQKKIELIYSCSPELDRPYGQIYQDVKLEMNDVKTDFISVQDIGCSLVRQTHPAKIAIEAYVVDMESQWSWLQQLLECLKDHIIHISAFKMYFQEASECAQWMTQQTENVKNWMRHQNEPMQELEQRKTQCQNLQKSLIKYEEHVASLAKRSCYIIPLLKRNEQLTSQLKVLCLCHHEQPTMSLQKDEECFLLDNGDKVRWRVKNARGQEDAVPSICLIIPPPNVEAVHYANRLKVQLEQLQSSFETCQRKLTVFSTIEAIKNWDLAHFKSQDPARREAVLKELNIEAYKLVEEGGEMDQKMQQELQKELDECNRKVQEFSRNILEEEASDEIRQIEDGGMSNTVEVSGFSTNTSQELLEMYFENSRRSGGGDLEEVQIRDGVAYITFKDAEVVQRVVSHKDHQVDGQTLTVTLFHPLPPKPCYENIVLIQGLNDAVTEELLRNYLETETKAEVREFLYGEEEGKVVVTFSDNVDFVELGKTFKGRSIEGAFLKVARVAISSCIFVQNIQLSTSRDTILFYFENKRRSCGGDVERVEMKADEGYCLVYFEDHSVIDRVLSWSHNIDGADVEVHIHHKCLGQRSSRNKSDPCLRLSSPGNKDGGIDEVENRDNQSNDEDSGSISSNPDKESDFVEVREWQENDGKNCQLSLWVQYKRAPVMKIIKDVIKIPCSWNFHVYWNFYTKTKLGKPMLHEILNKYNCSVAVCSEDEDLFIFEISEKSFEQELDVVHFIDTVLDNVHKCAQQFLHLDTLSVDQRIQGDVFQQVRQRKELDSARIEFMGQRDLDAKCVICTEKDKSSVLHMITEIIQNVKECFQKHEEIISVDHKWQKVLKSFGYLQKLGDKYPSVTIIPDETKSAIMLKGQRDQSKDAADHLSELLGAARSEVQEDTFSPSCQFEIFTYPEMCNYIDNIIMELSIVWIPNHMTKKIHLFSKKSEKIKGIDKLIKGCIQERPYPLPKDQSVLSTEMFRSLEELKKKHTGKIVINSSPKGLLLTTADDIFDIADDVVQKLIDKETEISKVPLKGKKEETSVDSVQSMKTSDDNKDRTEATEEECFESATAVWYIINIFEGRKQTRFRADPEVSRVLEEAYQKGRKSAVFQDKDTESNIRANMETNVLYVEGIRCPHAHIERVIEIRKSQLKGKKEEALSTAVDRGQSIQTSNDSKDPEVFGNGTVTINPGVVRYMDASHVLDDRLKALEEKYGLKSQGNGCALKLSGQADDLLSSSNLLLHDRKGSVRIKMDCDQFNLILARKIVHEMSSNSFENDEMVIRGERDEGIEIQKVVLEFLQNLGKYEKVVLPFDKEHKSKIKTFVQNLSEHEFCCYVEDDMKVRVVIWGTYEETMKLKNRLLTDLGLRGITKRNRKLLQVMTDEEHALRDKTGFKNDMHRSKHTLGSAVSYKTLEGLVVQVYLGDITKLEVDCIVNPVNEDLVNGAGVAFAIEQAAGFKFKENCKDSIQTWGRLNVGDVQACTAGDLKCKQILNAVGPRWSCYRNPAECLAVLKHTVKKCLETSNGRGYETIAIPSISAGIFGVPLKFCTQEYCQAVISFSKETPGNLMNLKEVHFVDISQERVDAIQTTFSKFLEKL